MTCVRWSIFLVFGSVAACGASAPPPVAKQAASEVAVQRAREAGADDVPAAVQHLQYAEEELENAKMLMSHGDNRTAARVLDRARVEADVAASVARATSIELQAVPPPVRAIGGGPLERADESPTAAPQAPVEDKPSRAESAEKARDALEKIAIMGVGSVRLDNRGTVICMPATTLFAGDSTTITPAARDNLVLVADAVKGPDGHRVAIEGYTDAQGNAASNKELSQRRADAVKEILVSHGVPADRIRAQGLGAAHPIADNGAVSGRTKNHRVEILIQAIEDK